MIFDYLVFRQQVAHFYLKCFSLLRAKYGVTQSEIELLLYLAEEPKTDTASGFIQTYAMNKSQVSMTVEQLVQKGLLLRKRDDRNRRVKHLTLSSAGDVLAEELKQAKACFAAALFDSFSEQERARLVQALEQVRADLSRR